MTKEGLEEVRRRLLGDQQVQQMIRDRAFEIYELRGGQPGGAAQDWLRAEREVLAFLIASESTRAKVKESRSSGTETAAAPTKRRSRGTSSSKKRSTKPAASKKPLKSKTKPKRTRKTPGGNKDK
jgi:Protein of unknown function (DUF2934)